MRALRAVVLVAAGCSTAPHESVVTSALVCGPGTMEVNGECVAPTVVCGMGTHESNNACVPDDVQFTLRARAVVVAEEETSIQVRAFGRNADGTPAHEQLVFNTDRPSAGAFDPPLLDLDDLGGVTSFTPCKAETPGCLGPLRLTAALASAPSIPVATVDIELVEEVSIGSMEHCLTGGDVLHIEGTNFLYRGTVTITDGTFERAGGTQRAAVTVTPTDASQGEEWSLEFSSVPLAAPLAPGVYRETTQFSTSVYPRMNVTNTSPYATCVFAYAGEFQVHEFQYAGSLERLAVSFRQWCGYPSKMIEGCVFLD